MGLAPSKYPPKNQKRRLCFEQSVIWDIKVRHNSVISGVNGVAMNHHGLILRENEATGSRKVFKYLPGLRDTIFISKIAAADKKTTNPVFYRIFIYGVIIV